MSDRAGREGRPPSHEGRKPNRLARETSPYLLQHAHNPVDWYPWGEEAFARARAEDKPILLSVGYATCHWCHVMERESFEDDAIAALLAGHFVAIKVDREELPDVDHVYMSALQALTGHGGWPMNMFLTPALEPFYGGTYFPPVGRPGLPSFADVLGAVADAWRNRRDELAGNARTLLAHVRKTFGEDVPFEQSSAVQPRPDSLRAHTGALTTLAGSFDPDWGGFGAAPKFPQPPLLQYLLALAAGGSARARTMLVETLHRMAQGGIYDHVGGGFARYSTDRRWHVPHFEKMLYDNVQLVRVYAGAWRLTGDARLRFVAEDTLAYLQREMRQPQASAAFSSAQDADAEGVEGRFHVWTLAQMREVLGDDAQAAARLYGATEAGNWALEGGPGQNVLERRDPEAVRAELGMDETAFARWEQSVRERLYVARSARVWPITDDKVLADWNALALRALAESGRLLERDDLVADASALAEFLLGTMTVNGLPRHAWRAGQLREQAYLSDAVQLALGLLELNAATGEPRWALRAAELAQRAIDTFHEPGRGFVDAPAGVLPLAARDRFDGATPSAIASACELLIRLAPVFDRPDWAAIAREEIARGAGLAARAPTAVPALLMAMLLDSHGGELARVGSDARTVDDARPDGGRRAVPGRSAFAPLVTIVSGPPDALPLLAHRKAGEAYLCRQSHCELPARDAATLDAQIAALHALGID